MSNEKEKLKNALNEYHQFKRKEKARVERIQSEARMRKWQCAHTNSKKHCSDIAGIFHFLHR